MRARPKRVRYQEAAPPPLQLFPASLVCEYLVAIIVAQDLVQKEKCEVIALQSPQCGT
jgi:hypothetical protein